MRWGGSPDHFMLFGYEIMRTFRRRKVCSKATPPATWPYRFESRRQALRRRPKWSLTSLPNGKKCRKQNPRAFNAQIGLQALRVELECESRGFRHRNSSLLRRPWKGKSQKTEASILAADEGGGSRHRRSRPRQLLLRGGLLQLGRAALRITISSSAMLVKRARIQRLR